MSVHIVGGGVAGLSAAVACIQAGLHVHLYEAAPALGGRCRSYAAAGFDQPIDNGAHAVLAGNAAVMSYLAAIGARDELDACRLEFHDLRSGAQWALRAPGSLWRAAARPPGVGARDLLRGARLFVSRQPTVAAALAATPDAMRGLWEPLCTAALNTAAAEADTATLRPVLSAMARPGGLGRGLLLPRRSLHNTYVAPAETWLQRQGAMIRTTAPLRALDVVGGRVTALKFDTPVGIAPDDTVVLALPPWSTLLGHVGVQAPTAMSPIVNAHFQWTAGPAHEPRFMGLIGGLGQWAWLRGRTLGITVSAADAVIDEEPEKLAHRLWRETAGVLGLAADALPAWQAIKERRATLRHRPGVTRPGPRTALANVFLAGDWTDTGLPCTLESAARSGGTAASLASARARGH